MATWKPRVPVRRARERLSAADASNVVLDARDQVNVFLMAGALGAGGFVGTDRTLDTDALRAAIAARLADGTADLDRFSQRVARDGQGLHWESWPPDLTRHVRLVDPVDGPVGLAGLCGALMTRPLPPDRPLWELLVVPGASPDGWSCASTTRWPTGSPASDSSSCSSTPSPDPHPPAGRRPRRSGVPAGAPS